MLGLQSAAPAKAARFDPRKTATWETNVRQWGDKIFALMDAAGPPSLFSSKGFQQALIDWAMKDESFKTQLFRFIDVLPALNSASEITRHLNEYIGQEHLKLPPGLRAALTVAGYAGGLMGGSLKAQVARMARVFMLGRGETEMAAALRKLHDQGAGFSVDVLGEAVVSEQEAGDYAAGYLQLMELLARATAQWPQSGKSNQTPRGAVPVLNISLKISAFYSQTHPADPETAMKVLSARLGPVLQRAKELGAFINFDMENFGRKDLTLGLFKRLFSEPDFADAPSCGIALQAYLRDSEADAHDLVAWARAHKRRITIRLVKGAYWDYETIIARQRGWPVPVFSHKPETDLNFEKLARYLLENEDVVSTGFGTHNVRSIAYVLDQAQRLGLDPAAFEFQVLHGMGDALRSALLQLGCRVREYCPIGELLPGMAYLVRRLLENTSNEGFLANAYARGADRNTLLRNPAELLPVVKIQPPLGSAEILTAGAPGFINEAPIDFTVLAERERIRAALDTVRKHFGAQHPLVINRQRIMTQDWLPSLNPANQNEIIGYSARATMADADMALEAAVSAQAKWRRTPADERARLANRLAELLRRDKAELTALCILEAGKNWTEADADVAEAIDYCNFYAAAMRELAKPRRTQNVPGERNDQFWWPRGVGAVIAPWNFPLAILTGMMAAAIMAGNAVIIKPSEQTSVIGAFLMERVSEAGFPAGVVNLLMGRGAKIGAYLVAHPKIDFIAFTGSLEVGLQIWQTAAVKSPSQANLKKVICEMGGKNCLIIDSDADLDEAVVGVLASAFGYQGQKCSALSRLVVLADNYQRFLDRLIAGAESLRIGPAEAPGNFMGPVIDRTSQQRILQVIEAGKKEARLAWLGRVPDDPNACYVPPAIFTEVLPNHRLFCEEVFGPVLSVTRAKDFDEALALANDCAFALTGGLYSRSPARIARARDEMVCGNFYLNRTLTGALVGRQPFGGFKMSGAGTKAGGIEYLQNFLVPRLVTENCLRRGFAPAEGN